jgi:DNA-binding NarL/FixJ family response regulator
MRQLLNEYPNLAVLVLSPYESEETLLAAFRSGARGYLDVNVSSNALIRALEALGRGEVVISRAMANILVAEYQRVIKLMPSVDAEIADMLTYREKEILRLLASEASNEQIAHELFISGNTVRVHIHNILEKLGMKNRREAAKFARRL